VRIGEDGKESTLSTPSASSPRLWMKMKAADLARSFGGEIGGMIMGGFLSVAILCIDEDQPGMFIIASGIH
jgi:hypothetical protein